MRLAIKLRGAARPPLDEPDPVIQPRVEIDLRPIRPDSRDDTDWLNALIWPLLGAQRRRLHTALDLARTSAVDLHAGDAGALLRPLIDPTDPAAVPCVFQTHAMNQFTPETRQRTQAIPEESGQLREVAFVSRHSKLTLDWYAPDRHEQILLAEADAHGPWITWLT